MTQVTQRFNLGDKVWIVRAWSHYEKSVLCPDCLGQRALTLIMGDGSRVSLACEACEAPGFEGPTGMARVWGFEVVVTEGTVTSVALKWGGTETEYRVNDTSYHNDEIFVTREEADVRAEKYRTDYEAEELARPGRKLKDGKNWAWHASYYRKEIKDCESRIAYATKALAVAKVKAKEVDTHVAPDR